MSAQPACSCGESLETPSERASGQCLICVFSPPDREPEPVSEEVLLYLARKWYRIGVEARAYANGQTWAAGAGYSTEAELRQDADEYGIDCDDDEVE